VVGTLLLFLRFYVFGSLWPGVHAGEALWQSAFQAVSAFNNAGFVIFPAAHLGGPGLIPFAADYVVLAITGALVIVGGLGYTVLRDVAVVRRITRFSLDTKLILLGSGVLIVLGGVLFFACEYGRPGTLGEMGVGDKLANSAFHSVASRTAGFNTVDYSKISGQSGVFTEALMFIGGASASTAGGIKVNTFMVVVVAVLATVRRRRYVSAFGREISLDVIRRAMVVGAVATAFVAVVVFTLSALEGDIALRDILFESFSAFGTVGLSSGITPGLGDASRVVLVVTMFVGRLGPLTLALLMAGREAHQFYRLAEEHVRIG
ncbi:MAG: TrkH family potassium uptake protein, partial [Gemmatimonadetes bacterium]|nr:TrkH family potassium uptake protein [Gemmatimonadota bacterium]